ncbi:uncharacterized protein PAE49_004566 [Odontesthes bonariensis]|uniref:uncharacterized protein LOC142379296 n=1 Tax=Odontesthes bonariensis TaxID=219752 RepID=UPI003F58B574
MPSISSFLLGLVVASVIADDISAQPFLNSTGQSANSTEINNNSPTTEAPITITIKITSTTNITGILRTTDSGNISDFYSDITSATTESNGVESSTDVSQAAATKAPSTKAPSTKAPSTKAPSTTPHAVDPKGGTTKAKKEGGGTAASKVDSTTITIVIIILIAAVLGVCCFLCVRKRGRRYSVDLTSRQDEASIPLSTMRPEFPADTMPENGLQTFESTDSAKEPQEPESEPEAQEEQKIEADKPAADTSTEPAAPAPDSSEDKPKEDVVEQNPPAPVEPSLEEKTDDEGMVSNKTSVESLKETNENNSNNADFGQKRDIKRSNSPWEVCLDCPV